MPLSLTRTVDAATEPITVGEAKAHLRVDDNGSDDLITAYIKAARNLVEEKLHRALITQTWQLQLDRFPGPEVDLATRVLVDGRIELPRPRLLAVSSITYVDGDGATQTMSSSLYNDDDTNEPARLVLAYGESWPTTRDQINAVTITYTAGYGSTAAYVPDAIKHALKLLVGHFWENREATIVGTIVAELPMAVDALLGPYRVETVY